MRLQLQHPSVICAMMCPLFSSHWKLSGKGNVRRTRPKTAWPTSYTDSGHDGSNSSDRQCLLTSCSWNHPAMREHLFSCTARRSSCSQMRFELLLLTSNSDTLELHMFQLWGSNWQCLFPAESSISFFFFLWSLQVSRVDEMKDGPSYFGRLCVNAGWIFYSSGFLKSNFHI